MKHPAAVRALWLALVTTVTFGCGPASSSVSNDLPTLTMQLADQLKTVNDEASAKAARPKLEELADQIHVIKDQVMKGKYPKPAKPDEFAERQNKAVDAYTTEFKRVSAIPDVVPQLQGMVQKLMK
jgi:hypothetical protein